MVSRQHGRVVVITGASSGIGRATAHAFAELDDTVVLAARRADMLHEVERECLERGGTALAIPTDMRHENEVEALGRQVLERESMQNRGVIRLLLLLPHHRSRAGSRGSAGGRRPRACHSARPCGRPRRAARSLCSSASAVLCSYA